MESLSITNKNENTPIEIKMEEPTIQIHQFTDTFLDTKIFFQVIFLKDSFFIWMGSGPPQLGHLSLSMKSKFDTIPSISSLLGDSVDKSSHAFAQRLAKKTGKPVFVSCSLPPNSPMIQSYAEKRLLQELKDRL